ncbi:AraC family transcriptional regulator [Aurantibacillus circumpalustris]|uniref:AraC family transcriptional regulator n=1 Tax=Aurantibacillus circumpalustris TaxID=3036359 RepID=UPI00295AD4BA|nr:AraC family transcriptional regulator [Aurantibacillus circumpalustris]
MSSYSKQVPVHAIKTKEMDALGFGIINLLDNSGKVYNSAVPHRHTFYELLFFIQAKGNHEIDFSHYPVENSSVHFVSPGQIHRLSLKKKNGYVVCFAEDFISLKSKERLINVFPYFNNSNYPVLHLTKELTVQLEELIQSIDFELNHSHADSIEICRSYLNVILLKLKTYFTKTHDNIKSTPSEKSQKVNQYKALIDENYLTHKTVSDYAEDLSISPNHLNALCKKQEGKTATQLIQERTLLEAKRLLYATDMHIKEISYNLHFEDVPYFNRFFKKQTKITPNEYRQQFRKKR